MDKWLTKGIKYSPFKHGQPRFFVYKKLPNSRAGHYKLIIYNPAVSIKTAWQIDGDTVRRVRAVAYIKPGGEYKQLREGQKPRFTAAVRDAYIKFEEYMNAALK